MQRIQLHIMGRGIKGEGLVKLVNNLYVGFLASLIQYIQRFLLRG